MKYIKYPTIAILLGIVIGLSIDTTAHAAQILCYSHNTYSCLQHTGYHGQSVWGYPGGHNCTNYVAYRLSLAGAQNPGNLGNAGLWARNARKKNIPVDNYPTPGSVAQWNFGHVGYVESVTDNFIEVTEDSYGNNITLRKRYFRGQSDWPNSFIHLATASSSELRIGFIRDGTAYMKGSPHDTWSRMFDGAIDIKASHNRIGVLSNDRNLYIKEGSLSAQWKLMADNVNRFDMTESRIGILRSGNLAIKEGSLNATWNTVADSVTDFSLDKNRIGIVQNNHLVSVKEGSLSNSWSIQTEGMQVLLANNRIAVKNHSKQLIVKEGSLNATWTLLADNVDSAAMSKDRVAIQRGDRLFVKQGSISSLWTYIADNVTAFSISGNEVGIAQGVEFFVKFGSLNNNWTKMADINPNSCIVVFS